MANRYKPVLTYHNVSVPITRTDQPRLCLHSHTANISASAAQISSHKSICLYISSETVVLLPVEDNPSNTV